jgi:hypothetical protein
MFLRNTSKHPDDEVRSLIEFAAKPFELRYVCVNVRGTSHPFAGMAYRGVPHMSNAPRTAKYLVALRIGAAHHFIEREITNLRTNAAGEKQPYGGKRSPLIHYRSWREALVAVAAHEFKHIEQFQTKKPAAEWQCERAAFNALERYRANT